MSTRIRRHRESKTGHLGSIETEKTVRAYKYLMVPTLEQPGGLPIPLSTHIAGASCRYVCICVLERPMYRVYRWKILGHDSVRRINNAVCFHTSLDPRDHH